TGANPNRALRFQVVRAFTDLLLHDMGPDLADICLGQAEPSEFRTEPLMGLRFATAFLHDGRAATVRQAVELHDGEARGARTGFTRPWITKCRSASRVVGFFGFVSRSGAL